ncbi:MAG: hypothetical protein IK123_11810, partial [Lachnospiraceae bacterium]|nr:hypothetical protein [Lachnospiraceae bacterium]
NGFLFGSKEDVELANQELSTVKYIESKTANRKSDTLLSVYQGAIDRKMFRTPVGYAYMHDLQKKMVSMGVKPDSIPGIPLYQVYNSKLDDELKPRRGIGVPKRKKKSAILRMNRNLIIANIILAVIIIALFVINIKGSTPTVLNYKNALENEYASWEQDLKQREDKIREKERELNIESSPPHITE